MNKKRMLGVAAWMKITTVLVVSVRSKMETNGTMKVSIFEKNKTQRRQNWILI